MDDEPSDRVWTIYSISAPDEPEPFYIGQTVKLSRRIYDHLRMRTKAHSRPR